MSGTGDDPANGGPGEGGPANDGPGDGHPAEGSADEERPADGGLPSGAGSGARDEDSGAEASGDAGSSGGGAHGGGPAASGAESGPADDSGEAAARARGGAGDDSGKAAARADSGGAGDDSAEAAAPAGSGGGGSGGGTSAGATAGPAGSADPGELLGEMRALRRRARLARHAYWFPLVLFGLLTLASVPFYIRRRPVGRGVFAFGRGLSVLQSGYLGGPGLLEVAEGTAYYWLAAMLLGVGATVLWYRWRGNRIGLRTPARAYLITGLVLLALALLIPVVSGRSVRLPPLWPGGYVISDLFPLVLIGLGLFVLAWSERSTGLAAIAAGYFAISLVANLYILNNVLSRLHWNLSPAAAALPNVVLPALVLLLTGAGAWVVQRRYRPPAEPESAEG
jgi:hypothetical protein